MSRARFHVYKLDYPNGYPWIAHDRVSDDEVSNTTHTLACQWVTQRVSQLGVSNLRDHSITTDDDTKAIQAWQGAVILSRL